jgi:hypothetical protein
MEADLQAGRIDICPKARPGAGQNLICTMGWAQTSPRLKFFHQQDKT